MKPLFLAISILTLCFSWFVETIEAAELIMYREPGCRWCEKWDEEIGSTYPKTVEGKRAPLRQLNIHDPIEDYIADSGMVHFTPTFVLVDDGQVVGRITGYPGEDNFWWLLEEMIAKLQHQTDKGIK